MFISSKPFTDINSLIKRNSLIKFTNCYLKIGDAIIYKNLIIRDGKIQSSEAIFFDEKLQPDIIIDCDGLLISAGFIDVQINGGYGRDFSDNTQDLNESLQIICRKLVKHGVTAICPTIITSSCHTYKKILSSHIDSVTDGAINLGFHLEGPWVALRKSGMHNKSLIQTLPDDELEKALSQMYGDNLENIRYVTLAPEISRSEELIRELVDKGIIVSLGHSEGSIEDGLRALSQGASMMTHLYCAMNPFHHRDPHLIGLLTKSSHQTADETPVYFGLITDLVHLHESAIRIAQRANPNGLIVVTDANLALGLDDGEYCFGSVDIEVKRGISYVKNTDILAGATTPLDKCLNNYWHSAGISLARALSSVTNYPAEAMRLAGQKVDGMQKGYLKAGFDADLVLLKLTGGENSANMNFSMSDLSDCDVGVVSTWIGGKMVFLDETMMPNVKVYVAEGRGDNN